MELIQIKLQYKDVAKKVPLSWLDILHGIEREYMYPESALEHAWSLITEETSENSRLYKLVNSSHSFEIMAHVRELAKEEKSTSLSDKDDKWLFLILHHLYTHKSKFADPLDLVELLHADFGYPERVSTFVKYMPLEEQESNPTESYEVRLYRNWEAYLEEEKKRFSINK